MSSAKQLGAHAWLNLSPVTVSWLIVGYGFVASVLPVWLLLAPRDYLSTFMKVGAIALLAIGICVAHPVMQAPAVSHFATHGDGPVFAGSLFPFLFITIACGALSGFHALISSGTTPKLLEKESQMRLIGYGGMLTESFVAVMALISASILDQHLYFALNAPTARTGGTAATAADYVNHLGLSGPSATAAELTDAAAGVGEKSIVSRTGGAPTLAVGMSEVLQRVLGGSGLKAFWYHFAIMFEALFILTAVDAGTRVARFMLSDALGNLGGPLSKLRNPSWRPGVWMCSLAVAAAWGSILLMGVTDPLGGINTLFPLFGIANQLLAAIALTVVTVVVIKKGYLKWAWIPGDSVAVGSDGHADRVMAKDLLRRRRRRLLDSALPIRKRPSIGQDVVRVGQERRSACRRHQEYVYPRHAVRPLRRGGGGRGGGRIVAIVRAIRGGGLPLSEDDPVPSKIFAPSGMIATAGERKVQRQWRVLALMHLDS